MTKAISELLCDAQYRSNNALVTCRKGLSDEKE